MYYSRWVTTKILRHVVIASSCNACMEDLNSTCKFFDTTHNAWLNDNNYWSRCHFVQHSRSTEFVETGVTFPGYGGVIVIFPNKVESHSDCYLRYSGVRGACFLWWITKVILWIYINIFAMHSAGVRKCNIRRVAEFKMRIVGKCWKETGVAKLWKSRVGTEKSRVGWHNSTNMKSKFSLRLRTLYWSDH